MLSSYLNLSVIIVTWRGDELLRECLDSINRIYGTSVEIVVVDNGCLASTKGIVSLVPNTKYLASPTNLGFAGGNNLGFPHCTRKYVLLLNNDTVVREDSFSPMIEYMEAHPRVAVTQGKMRLRNEGDVLDTCGVMLTPFGMLYDPFVMRDIKTTNVVSRPVYAAKGALMMFRRSVIQEVGGVLFYDHFHCNHEETDFCHRVWLAGYEVHFVDTPAVDHLQSQTISKLNRVEVCAQSLANQLFSLRTTLGLWGRMRILPRFYTLYLALVLSMLIKGQWGMIRSYVSALVINRRRRAFLVRAKKAIGKWRKISDRDLFERVMAHPPMAYYYYALRGNLVAYNGTHGVL